MATRQGRRESEARLIKVLDLEDFAVEGDVRAYLLSTRHPGSAEVRTRLLDLLSVKRGHRMSASGETWELLAICLADRLGDCLDCAREGVHRRICHAGPCGSGDTA